MGLKEFIFAVTNLDRDKRNAELDQQEIERIANGGRPTIYDLANVSLERAQTASNPIDARMAHSIPAEKLIPQIRSRARMQIRSSSK